MIRRLGDLFCTEQEGTMRTKITVVGAGNVGATTAQRLAERTTPTSCLSTSSRGSAGKALDLNQAGPVVATSLDGRDERVRRDQGSEIPVITSGIARKPAFP